MSLRVHMPKLKTHKGAAKRFKLTGTGKVKHKRPYHSHLLTSKNAKRKMHHRLAAYLVGESAKNIKRLLPCL
jgi:large subunit ribosomal protein L35